MGLCVSCDGAAVSAAEQTESASTAKVILPDGRLQEHCGGAGFTVWRVLLHTDLSPPSAFFLCSADDLDDEGRVAALADNEELEPGQIYFVLPADMLKRRLTQEEMAKLAVRAARAITEAGVVMALGDPYEDLEEKKKTTLMMKKKVPAGAARMRRTGGVRGRHFASDLDAIPE